MSTRKISHQQAPRKTPPPNDSTTKVMAELEPADLPPLPPSPIPSAVSQIVSTIGCDTTALVQDVRQHQRSMAVKCHRLLKNTQGHVDNGCILHENNGVHCSYNMSDCISSFSPELRTVLRCPRENEGAEGQGALR
ncbi:hypothetical protein JB92DRAFT_2827886 [Gautieria morchelliformis]|nr:hypothetical protein JB92DRAFT_2827886 [Gautieria morchelliformis]